MGEWPQEFVMSVTPLRSIEVIPADLGAELFNALDRLLYYDHLGSGEAERDLIEEVTTRYERDIGDG